MTAMETLQFIEDRFKKGIGTCNVCPDNAGFLLKAFRVMREITIVGYLDGTYLGTKEGAEEWLNEQFEERMKE